jgi:hypothetical protein
MENKSATENFNQQFSVKVDSVCNSVDHAHSNAGNVLQSLGSQFKATIDAQDKKIEMLTDKLDKLLDIMCTAKDQSTSSTHKLVEVVTEKIGANRSQLKEFSAEHKGTTSAFLQREQSFVESIGSQSMKHGSGVDSWSENQTIRVSELKTNASSAYGAQLNSVAYVNNQVEEIRKNNQETLIRQQEAMLAFTQNSVNQTSEFGKMMVATVSSMISNFQKEQEARLASFTTNMQSIIQNAVEAEKKQTEAVKNRCAEIQAHSLELWNNLQGFASQWDEKVQQLQHVNMEYTTTVNTQLGEHIGDITSYVETDMNQVDQFAAHQEANITEGNQNTLFSFFLFVVGEKLVMKMWTRIDSL